MQGGKEQAGQKSTVLPVDQEQQEFVFTDITSEPVPSLLRNFSAPVKMEVKSQTDDDLIFLLAHDTGMPITLLLFLHVSQALTTCLVCSCRRTMFEPHTVRDARYSVLSLCLCLVYMAYCNAFVLAERLCFETELLACLKRRTC